MIRVKFRVTVCRRFGRSAFLIYGFLTLTLQRYYVCPLEMHISTIKAHYKVAIRSCQLKLGKNKSFRSNLKYHNHNKDRTEY